MPARGHAITAAERRFLQDILKRTKGWPVGVPCEDDATAKRLLDAGYLRYAPPLWVYPKPRATYGLTTRGEVEIGRK